MNRVLLKKCLLDVRLLFAACALALFAFCWLRVYIVSRLELSSFAAIIEKLWDKWKDFWPVPLSHLLTYTGRIGVTFDEPIVVFCIAIFAIARGSDSVSGELNRGTLEMLLAQPVSRLQVLYSQALVTTAALALLCLVGWCGIWAGVETTQVTEEAPRAAVKVPGLPWEIPYSFEAPKKVHVPMRTKVRMDDFIPGSVVLFSLGFCLAGVSTLFSSWDRYRWRTIGLAVTFYVIHLILKIMGMAIPEVSWLKKLSIFTAYEPQKFIAVAAQAPDDTWRLAFFDPQGNFGELGPLGYNLVLLGIGGVCYLAAGVMFHQRDLPAPL